MGASGALEGKVAVVTGGARGIGHAIAKRYLAEGARVVIGDLADRGADIARALDADRCRFVRADVGSADDARRLVEETCAAFGGIDVLVNNAGIIHTAEFLDIAEGDFDKVMRVNLKGVFLVGQAAARRMVAQLKDGRAPGSIINMSSITARLAIPNQVPYCVSKAGVSQLTTVMSLALAPHGIRVNAIGPGSIMTDILRAVAHDAALLRQLMARTPIGRIGDPQEIAAVAVFLASAESSYITGQTIFADGGRLGLNYVVPVKDGA